MNYNKYKAVCIGVSAGGLKALCKIIPKLDKDYGLSVIIVAHRHCNSDDFLAVHLNKISKVKVKEAYDKENIIPGVVYVAPAGYHLLIEQNNTFALNVDPLVNYSRPSIDVLFETAAEVYENNLIGLILTGANSDGSKGLKKIKDYGGLCIVENPSTAEVDQMPLSATKAVDVDCILDLEEIADFLNNFKCTKECEYE